MSNRPQKLPYLNAKQVRENGRQYYLNAQGDRFPSVTTILNATKPQADRERLLQWRQRIGLAEATRISTAAGRRGTSTHKYIEQYLQGEEISCPESVRPYWDSIEPVLQEISDVQLVEGTVFHDDLRYAGRLDCVASYRGIPCVCDWKTADFPKGSIERLFDYPLQLAAYQAAFNESYQGYDIQLNHALLVVAIAHHPAEVFWFKPDAIALYWQQWTERLAEFWQR